MSAVTCERCGAGSPMPLGTMPNGQTRYACSNCDYAWSAGPVILAPTIHTARAAFTEMSSVDPARTKRVDELKADFLRNHPKPEPAVAAFWTKYQQAFSESGLDTADPIDLKAFANSSVGANPGDMSVFNTEWNQVGAAEGAGRVREATRYLLYGPEEVPMEDRLTNLLEPGTTLGMKGWKEALLTKTLCVMYPDKYLPIVKYDGMAGKRQLAAQIWGVQLPAPDATQMTIGRLIVMSNKLLSDLARDGFAHQQHKAQFLWMAKDHEANLAGS